MEVRKPVELARIVNDEDCIVCIDPLGAASVPKEIWKLCQLHILRLKFVLDQKGLLYKMRPDHGPAERSQ